MANLQQTAIQPQEIWKIIDGTNGAYSVSNLGRIYSYINNKQVNPTIVKGYCVVSIRINGKRKCLKVHRLVASAFIENQKNLPSVNHKDGNKKNNTFKNLEWCDTMHNRKHAISTGLWDISGENNVSHKITEADVYEIFNLRKSGLSQRKIADKFGLTQNGVSKVLAGWTWSHIYKKITGGEPPVKRKYY